MNKDPILKRVEFNRVDYHGRMGKCVLRVHGGLHWIQGNSSPYFSLTVDYFESGLMVSCGCCHELIAEHCPGEFDDLAALHSSGIDGKPLHAAANGLYWLAGCSPDGNGYGETYHGASGGNGETIAECLQIACDHFRCKPEDLASLRDSLLSYSFINQRKERLALVQGFCDGQAKRWKFEADACIERHGLKVYGECGACLPLGEMPAQYWKGV